MARGWNHLGASLLRHLGLDAGCPLEPVLCVSSAWQLLDSWTSQASARPRAPRVCPREQGRNCTACSHPALEVRLCHFPQHSVGYKQVTNTSRFKGRGQRPYVSVGGVARSHCGSGDTVGAILGNAVLHTVFTRWSQAGPPSHQPHQLLILTCHSGFGWEPVLTALSGLHQASDLDIP